MATWQFDLHLVPSGNLIAAVGASTERITEDQFDQIAWWNGVELPNTLEYALNTILPPAEAWAAGIEAWGAEDGNRLEIYRVRGEVDEVRVRIDVRQLDLGFIEGVVRIASSIGCIFLTEELEVVKPDALSLLTEIRNSSAHRFLINPHDFFDEDERV